MSFFSSHKKEEIVALFDISSGSVGGAIVLVSSHEAPTILATHRISFVAERGLYSEAYTKSMLSAIGEVASRIQKDAARIPEHVYAVLSSPWAESSLRHIGRHRPEGFVFTKKFAKELAEEETLRFKHDHLGFDEIIDKRLVHILLNGYELKDPYGKRARELDMHLFLSLSSSELIAQIEEIIMRTYHRSIKFTSRMFADALVLRDMFDTMNDFIVLNVHEEVTEVLLLQNDVMVGTASLPYGTNTCLRSLADVLGTSVSDIESLLKLYHAHHLHDVKLRHLDRALTKCREDWNILFKKALQGLSVNLLIPHRICIVGKKHSSDWLLPILAKQHFGEFTTTEDSFHVIMADIRILHDFCNSALHVEHDPPLMMQSIFINKINFQ